MQLCGDSAIHRGQVARNVEVRYRGGSIVKHARLAIRQLELLHLRIPRVYNPVAVDVPRNFSTRTVSPLANPPTCRVMVPL